jgi:hypothetical protein
VSAGKDDPRPFSAFWPGTEGLANVAITCYNRAFSTPNHQYTESFVEAFDEAYTQVSPAASIFDTCILCKSHGVRIACKQLFLECGNKSSLPQITRNGCIVTLLN